MNVFFVHVRHSSSEQSRTWGFFADFEAAEKAVLSGNSMWEMGYYDLAVIEEFADGLYPIARSERWYHATSEDQGETYKVVAIEKPERFKQVVNFSIG